jgi:hypothetical protein
MGRENKELAQSNVHRVADLVAIRIGRAKSPGRPIVWSPRPEFMQNWRWVGLKRVRTPPAG